MSPDCPTTRALRKLLKTWRVVAALPARFHDSVWHRIWHHERTNKKTRSEVFSIIAGLLLPLFASGCASTGGKQETRVYEVKQDIQLSNLRKTGRESKLKSGDAIAMVCTKCSTILYYPPVSPFVPRWYFEDRERIRNSWAGESRASQNSQYRHYCPGCKSEITVIGSSLNGMKTVAHTCESGGDDSVFSCFNSQEAAPDRENGPKNKH